MEHHKITCDGCGANITARSNSVDYRLRLSSEMKPGYGSGFYTDMMIYPAIEADCHFCRLSCLDTWRDRAKHEAKLHHDWMEAWIAERGTRTDRFQSYPDPPRETMTANKAAFAAAALEAFPMRCAPATPPTEAGNG